MNERNQETKLSPHSGDALLIVDVQRDFLPDGALGVPGGNVVVPVLNRYLGLFRNRPVIFSRDWHPENHVSFRAQGGPWPAHCIAGSTGAAFAPGLEVPASALVISKATEPGINAYSAFDHTELADWLRLRSCSRLFVGGLATDYCVRASVLDALAEGFAVILLVDAIRAVDVQPSDGERAIRQMLDAGALAATLAQFGGEQS